MDIETLEKSVLADILAAADEPAEPPAPAPGVTVGEIMSQPVVTTREDATLAEVARLMRGLRRNGRRLPGRNG